MTPADPLLDWLFALHGPALRWDMDTSRAFCAALGHPERRVPALHVAGTNGKGSVSAFAHAIALASDLRAGLYTSPHLVRPEERIRIGADDIGAGQFRALVARLRDAAEDALAAGLLPRHPSFFEIMTAAAFVAFSEARLDLAVIETGLGGRLDATNVLTPRLSVITTIGLDHVPVLGHTLTEIAGEKAGIIKPGVPVLAGWIAARPMQVIAEAADRAGAPLHRAAHELRLRRRAGGTFDLVTPERVYRGLNVALPGPHQLRNAALAVRATELLRAGGLALGADAVARGLSDVRWPGRLERLASGQLASGWPPAAAWWLDGAHNAEGVRALARTLELRLDRPSRRVLVFGVTEGRTPAELIAMLAPHVDRVVVTRPQIAKGLDASDVWRAVRVRAPQLEPELVPEPAAALDRAARLAGPDGEVLVAGSLYLVGDARRLLLGLDGTGHPPRETHLAAARPGDVTR